MYGRETTVADELEFASMPQEMQAMCRRVVIDTSADPPFMITEAIEDQRAADDSVFQFINEHFIDPIEKEVEYLKMDLGPLAQQPVIKAHFDRIKKLFYDMPADLSS